MLQPSSPVKKTFVVCLEVPNDASLLAFIKEIKSTSVWAKITKHTWGIVTTEKASELRDRLIKALPEGSRILVVKSGSVSAWRNVICSNEWLKKNL